MSSSVLHRIDGPSVRFESPLYRAVPAITTHACHSISDVGHTSAVLSLFRRLPLSGSFLPFFHNPHPFPLSALFLRCHQPRARAVYSVALHNELGTVYTMQIEFPLHSPSNDEPPFAFGCRHCWRYLKFIFQIDRYGKYSLTQSRID